MTYSRFTLLISTFFALTLFTSCAGYINKMYREFDKEGNVKGKRGSDPFAQYRKSKDARPIKNPMTYSRESTRDIDKVDPSEQRDYRAEQKRLSTNDFKDQDNSGSLWTNKGQSGFLFAKNKQKTAGDIVIIKVQSKLKEDIASELKRAYPPPINTKKAPDAATSPQRTEVANQADATTRAEENEQTNDISAVYDQISGVVAEEINLDYLLIRGKKDVLYNKGKHSVEIQVLINRRDVSDDDSVLSSNILESNIEVLR